MMFLRRTCVQLEVNLVQSDPDCIFMMPFIFDIFSEYFRCILFTLSAFQTLSFSQSSRFTDKLVKEGRKKSVTNRSSVGRNG